MCFDVPSKMTCPWRCIIALCVHLCCFSPLWVSMWLFRCPARPNEWPHSAHLCTFSPVWMVMCILKASARPNDFSHSEQVWALTPLWMRMCLFRCRAWPKDFWQWTQVCIGVAWFNSWTEVHESFLWECTAHIEGKLELVDQLFSLLLSLMN